MKKRLLDLLVCPNCKSSLSLRDETLQKNEIREGYLECMKCRSRYEIRNFIPRFVVNNNYASSFGLQWRSFRKTQLDRFSGIPQSFDRFTSETGWNREQLKGKLVLDCGCGAGRFTDICAQFGAEVIAFDSSSAVEACQENCGFLPNVHVVQADIYDLPFRQNFFDYVFCIGVIQHTPDPHKAVRNLLKYPRKKGQIALSIYEKRRVPHPRYLLRPITTRIPEETLSKLVNDMVKILLPISCLCSRIPMIGRIIRFLIPVANYEGSLQLNKKQIYEWALLDTFDWFAPKYDQPQHYKDVYKWLKQAGYRNIKRTSLKQICVQATR